MQDFNIILTNYLIFDKKKKISLRIIAFQPISLSPVNKIVLRRLCFFQNK